MVFIVTKADSPMFAATACRYVRKSVLDKYHVTSKNLPGSGLPSRPGIFCCPKSELIISALVTDAPQKFSPASWYISAPCSGFVHGEYKYFRPRYSCSHP